MVSKQVTRSLIAITLIIISILCDTLVLLLCVSHRVWYAIIQVFFYVAVKIFITTMNRNIIVNSLSVIDDYKALFLL